MPDIPDILKDMGKSKATPIVELKPGKAPIIIPTKVPTNIANKGKG